MVNHVVRIAREREPFREYNDCTVRATAAATGAEYGECHDMWRVMGARQHRSAAYWTHAKGIFDALGYDLAEFNKPANVKTPITAARFLPADQTFILLTHSHVMCMREGEVHDNFKEDRIRISSVLVCTPIAVIHLDQITEQTEMKLWR